VPCVLFRHLCNMQITFVRMNYKISIIYASIINMKLRSSRKTH